MAKPTRTQDAGRLLSLDVFRGIAIAGMILVNSSGSDDVYLTLQHSPWNGLTSADLVFPAFLFAMGVSVVFSLGRRRERGEPFSRIMDQVLWRTAVIFALGLITSLAAFAALPHLRLPGVLQRISVCYLLTSLIFLAGGPASQAAWAAALLGGYWLLMTQVPVPGFGRGDLSPEGNLASWLDRLVLDGHMFHAQYDPEGLLSTLGALATSLIGVLAGSWLRSDTRSGVKAFGLAAAGVAAALAGASWGLAFPINKSLWTSSYALLTAGLSLCGLALCYGAIELGGLKAWGRPFEMFGRNPLLAYVLSGLLYDLQEFVKVRLPGGAPGNVKLWLCAVLFGSWLPPRSASLAYALAYTCLCLGLMAFLYRKRVFLKV